MRKYLMTGVAAIALCAAFTSCSKNEELYDAGQITKNEAAQIEENYNKAFIAAFGQPAANQDWGFGSNAKTRGAMTRGGSNMWANQTVWPMFPVMADPTEEPGTLQNYYSFWQINITSRIGKDFWIQQVYKGWNQYKGWL